MKNCPTCQQVYSEDYMEVCPNDGSRLISSQYNPQWQGGQQQQPPPGWPPPPAGGYYPPPYGMPYPPQNQGGAGLATAALWTGISTAACLAIGFVLIFSAVSSIVSDPSSYRYRVPPGVAIGAILILLSYVVGLTALILGIIAAAMSGKNQSISKPKAIVGICLGAVPFILMILGLLNGSAYRRF